MHRYKESYLIGRFGIEKQMVQSMRIVEQGEARSRSNRALEAPTSQLSTPKLGWIRTIRTALGMSGEALARRMGLSRTAGVRLESSEASASITLKSLQAAAEAMNCRVVYALVPKDSESVEGLVQRQVDKKARRILAEVSPHMALEAQSLTDEAASAELKRLRNDLMHRMPRDLWDD